MSDPTPTASPATGAPFTGAPTASVICPRCGTLASAGSRFCPSCGSALSASGEVGEDHLLTRLRQATQGEYDVLREVGHGGMAAVYLAWDRELARYVAIKVLLPELEHHPTMSQRFLQEARTAANLDDHPSVVRVYRAKEAQGLRYFVMKYVDGCSLDQLLRSAGPLAPDLAAHVVDQVALALQYAHEHGVVHRDVKPGNILLDRAGGVVVTDFGIAKVAEAEQLTRTGFAIGTPHYMSPEQWRIEPLTPASDQYALGVVAYHLVTGEVPFDGTQYAIQEQHLRTEPPVLSARRDGVPAAFGAVVRVMLAKTPNERFPDLRSVSQALSAIPRDSAPVLRERLSRLIPAANTPGVREVPPPDVPSLQPEVAVERRAAASSGAEPSAPEPVVPIAVLRPPPAIVAPTTFTPVASVPSIPPVPRPVEPAMTPPATPAIAMPVVAAAPAPPPLPAPSLHATTFTSVAPARPAPTPTPAAAIAVVPADEPAATSIADDSAYATPPGPLLDGPITRRESQRRIWPWLAAAVVTAMLIGGGVAVHSTQTGATVVKAPPPVNHTETPPTPVTPVTSDGSTKPATDTGVTARAGVVDAPQPEDPSPPEPPPTAGPPGPPVAVLIAGAPTRGTINLTAGDSVHLRARVNDARGTRLVAATVQWTSSDPARVAFRNGYAVGIAPGGPVDVTAASGSLSRAVHLVVMPRAGAVAAPPRVVARPTPGELRGEVQRFVASLEAHDVSEVSHRLAPRAVDGSASREFVTWLEGTKGLTADSPALGDASDEGNRARVAFRVPLRWRGGGGSLGEQGRKDVTFWMTLAHDDQGWHGGEVLLGGKVAP